MVMNRAGGPAREPMTNGVARDGSIETGPMPIAVVGMACRFAGGATSPEKLWDLCATGKDAWTPIPESRFDVESLYDANPEKPGRNHVTGGYFLEEDLGRFDAAFFNFTSDVASAMDPQLRLLLEVVYEATEDSGIPIEKLAGPKPNTSVFTGCFTTDYHDVQIRDPEVMPPSTLTGNFTAMLSNRISHFYDFQGASMSIDTGCSGALVALHQGCQTLRAGESNVSIVGASNIILNPDFYIATSTLGMVGADGRCYAWDTRAQGYGRGEGVAALVLKPLEAALRDGDRVHAVIRNSALNQDGKTTTITSPSMDAQVRLINDCYLRAGLDPVDTGFVEAHMTGTKTGDAIEAESLARTFGNSRTADDPVWIGSVKTNVGHTENVSGLAGIIKAAMGMKYRAIAPNQNYIVGSDKIPLYDWRMQVPTHLVPWPQNKPLRTSVNNFGYGGANSHVILEGAPEYNRLLTDGHATSVIKDDNVSRLYLISAQDSATVKSVAKNIAAYLRERLETKTTPSLRDLAYTLAERRTRLSWVAPVRARSISELAGQLELESAVRAVYAPANKKAPRIGFVFNGQGAQWHAMGRELLLGAYPVFAAAVDEADRTLRAYGAGWSLREELLRDAESTRVSEIHLGQPITVALQICLVVLLRAWGIHPSAVTSHSSGEISAAYAAGALSFEQALGVTYWRGELARNLLDADDSGVSGGMAAGGVGPDEAARYAARVAVPGGGRVVVACINSPGSVTFSGDSQQLEEVVAQLEADGKFARKLKVPLAYHSHHMQRMAKEYAAKLRAIVPSKVVWHGDVAYTSPVTGGPVLSPDALSPDHYVRNLTNPVLFSDAFETMCFSADGKSVPQVEVVLEIGPHDTLAGPIRQILKGRKMAYTTCLKRGVDAVETMQNAASELVRLGYPVALRAVNFPSPPAQHESNTPQTMHFVDDLPSYPWNHKNIFWVESRLNQDNRHKKFPSHELLGIPVSGAVTPTWRNFLRLADLPWVADHIVDGMVVLPGAAYVSMAIEAARLLSDPSEKDVIGYRVRDVAFLGALAVPESSSPSGSVEVYLTLHPCHEADNVGWYRYEVRSLAGSGVWVENSSGLVSVIRDTREVADIGNLKTEAFLPPDNIQKVDGPTLRSQVAEMGIEYGPAFQGLLESRVSSATKRSTTDLRIKDFQTSDSENPLSSSMAKQTRTSSSYTIHPTTLDCVFQATYNNLPSGTRKTSMVLPRSIQSMFVTRGLSREAGDHLTIFSELSNAQRQGFASNVSVANAQSGEGDMAILAIDEIFCQAIPRALEEAPTALISHTSWEPDILHNIPSPVVDAMRITLREEEVDFEKKLARASYYLISDAVSALSGESFDSWTLHSRELFDWMQRIVELGKSGRLAPGSKTWQRASKGVKQILFDELKDGSVSHCSSLVIRVGQKLADIIRGEITAAEAAEQNEPSLRDEFYRSLPSLQSRSYRHVAKLVQLFAVKTPGAKVLEISGAPGTTKAVLEAFIQGTDRGSLLGRYTIAGICPDTFDKIKESLARWAHILDFSDADLAQENPVTHLTPQSVDLVVASMTLTGTTHKQAILKSAKRFLKPCGKLILVESTEERLDAQLLLGALHEKRDIMKVEEWDEVLRASGFSGVEFDISDCEEPQHQQLSTILSSVLQETVTPSLTASIVVQSSSDKQKPWALQLSESIRGQMGMGVVIESLDEMQPDEAKLCVIATDLNGGNTILDSLAASSFEDVKRVLLGSPRVLWLTSSGGAIDHQGLAGSAQVQGLLRTLRHEDTTKTYMLLDLPRDWMEQSDGNIGHIIHVVQQMVHDVPDATVDFDWEYAVKDSVLHVPRIYPIEEEAEKSTYVSQPFQQVGRKLVLEALPTGEAAFIAKRSSPATAIPKNVVEIAVKAFSLPQDTLNSEDGKNAATYEIAGIVTAHGEGTSGCGLRVGEAVCGIVEGPISSTVQMAPCNICKIPEELSLEDVTCMPLAYGTAHHALTYLARIRKGDKVMILGSVYDPSFRAALILANLLGGDVLLGSIDGTQEATQALIAKYGCPPCRILANPGTRNFAKNVMEWTAGKGVDIIVSYSVTPLAGSLLLAVLRTIARFGRFVEVGPAAKMVPIDIFASRCATYSHVDALEFAKHGGELMGEALAASLQLVNHSPTKTLASIATRFPVSQLERALQHTKAENNSFNRVVVISDAGELVNVKSEAPSHPLADEDATYLIVGGVGSIGGAIASWMAAQGAKHVVVVSRRAESHPSATSLAGAASDKGCNLRFLNCDIANERSLADLVAEVSAVMPPIRGVVHAAAVLEDSVLERMTYEQWQRGVQPKVAGTRNLHKLLSSSDLSFFVMLSSLISVIGNISQASYGAGNAFEDALAHHRATSNLPAISINLPGITSVGMIADAEATLRRVEALGTVSIPVEDVFGLIGDAISARFSKPQVLVGLRPWDQLPPNSLIRRDRRFGTLRLADSSSLAPVSIAADVGNEAASRDPSTLLAQAIGEYADEEGSESLPEIAEAVAQAVAARLSVIFSIPVEDVDLDLGVAAHGVDSLVAVDLRNWLASVAKTKMSIFDILQSSSLRSFGALVLKRSAGAK